jgi:hypothetical protein
MVVARSGAQACRVPRLLVLWTRPHHLTAEEAGRWAHAEVRRLLLVEGVSSARLTRLESASPRLAREWDWLLELEIAAPVADSVDHGPCAEWLADLRLLGMRPAVVLAPDDHFEGAGD